MSRLSYCVCVLAIIAIMAGALKASEPARPNVIMISLDDLKDWVNCLGGYDGRVYTPNIDRLAKRGMLFTNAHCVSPLCAPSRTAVLTGLRPSTTGLYGNAHRWRPVLPDAVTLPQCFMNAGYRVEGGGKVYHNSQGFNPPDQWHHYHYQAYDEMWELPQYTEAKVDPTKRIPTAEEFPLNGLTKERLGKLRPGFAPSFDWGAIRKSDAETGDGQTARWAASVLEATHEKPFFIVVGLFKPHQPWNAPQKYFDLYPLDEIAMPVRRENDLDDVPAAGQELSAPHASSFQIVQATETYRQAVQAYLATTSFVDAQVGVVLDALDRGPNRDNTIVVLWSDHGFHHGEKDRWHKMTLWEEATRVPLIISAPGITKPGSVCSRPASLIDLFPTLAELCGIEAPTNLDGQSMLPLLKDPEAPWDRPALTTYMMGNHAVRSDYWRYIRYADGSEELYDHRVDPQEWTNLAADSKYADIKQEHARWLPTHDAPPAPGAKAFDFDLKSYTWTKKERKSRDAGNRKRQAKGN